MKRKTGIRFSSGIATVLTERMLDLIAILSCSLVRHRLVATSRRFTLEQRCCSDNVGLVAGAILLAMLAFVIGIVLATGSIRRVHERLGPSSRSASAIRGCISSTRSPARSAIERSIPRAFAESHGAHGHHLGVPLLAVLVRRRWRWRTTCRSSSCYLLTGVTIVGMMIPTPGGVGGFHKVVQVALIRFYALRHRQLGRARARSLHVVGTLPVRHRRPGALCERRAERGGSCRRLVKRREE